MVYGFSVLERYAPFKRFKKYLIFGLTDETYALITTLDPPDGADPEFFDFCVTALNQSYWTAGGLIGFASRHGNIMERTRTGLCSYRSVRGASN